MWDRYSTFFITFLCLFGVTFCDRIKLLFKIDIKMSLYEIEGVLNIVLHVSIIFQQVALAVPLRFGIGNSFIWYTLQGPSCSNG